MVIHSVQTWSMAGLLWDTHSLCNYDPASEFRRNIVKICRDLSPHSPSRNAPSPPSGTLRKCIRTRHQRTSVGTLQGRADTYGRALATLSAISGF